MLNCYQLNLPKISNRLQIDLLKYANQLKSTQGHNPSEILGKEEEKIIQEFCLEAKTERSNYVQHELPDDLTYRLQNEMSDNLFPFSKIRWFLQIISGGNRFMPHRDTGAPGRKISLLYNLIEDTATTHFYKSNYDSPDRFVFSMKEVIPIQDIKMKTFTWYVMNNYCIHGVSKITKPRIALTCDMNFHPELEIFEYLDFYKKYRELLIE